MPLHRCDHSDSHLCAVYEGDYEWEKKIDGIENVALSEECSAATNQPMPPKLQDSGVFLSLVILVVFLFVVPYVILVLVNVPVKVKNLHFPADFIVLDISEDVDIPIILGRPFLYTAKAVIDMDRCSLALRVGSDRIVFNLPDMSKSPSLFADCDILDSAAVNDPISLTSIEPYRVLQGCPVPMNVCAVSTEGAAGAKWTTGSGKEPCEGRAEASSQPR
ncbi:unnamed protein product [Rhodiola kirilowii]